MAMCATTLFFSFSLALAETHVEIGGNLYSENLVDNVIQLGLGQNNPQLLHWLDSKHYSIVLSRYDLIFSALSL